MVTMILANHEVGTVLLRRKMMYLYPFGDVFTQCTFSHDNMFKKHTFFVATWVGRCISKFISISIITFFEMFSKSVIMTKNKPHRFVFFPSSCDTVLLGDIRLPATSTLAQSIFDHFILQIKRLISRLMRVTAFDHYPRYSQPRHDGGIKIPSSRIRFYYTLMRNCCQTGEILFCN